MIKWMVAALFFVAILADIYIYRSVIRYCFRRLFARIAYIIFALLTDATAIVAFLLMSFAGDGSSAKMVAVMWLVWAFILTSVPKLLYGLGGFLDFSVKLVVRRRSIVFRIFFTVLSVAIAVTMVCGATVGRTKLRVEVVEICSERVPEAFDGYRLVQISDIHTGTTTGAEKRLTRLVEKIASLSPDMVVHTGDLVNISGTELTPEIMDILSLTDAPDGVFSVWGNHDLGFYLRDEEESIEDNFVRLAGKVREMGWRVLADESVWIGRGGDSILLSGVNFPTDGHHNGLNSALAGADIGATFAGVDRDPFSIVLAHTPQMWSDITDRGFGDLTLSGHTHAMQMKFRLFGREWSPAEYMYSEWSGKYSKEGGKKNVLYVNDGIGCVGYPMRIGARPEVTLIVLKRCE